MLLAWADLIQGYFIKVPGNRIYIIHSVTMEVCAYSIELDFAYKKMSWCMQIDGFVWHITCSRCFEATWFTETTQTRHCRQTKTFLSVPQRRGRPRKQGRIASPLRLKDWQGSKAPWDIVMITPNTWCKSLWARRPSVSWQLSTRAATWCGCSAIAWAASNNLTPPPSAVGTLPPTPLYPAAIRGVSR